MNIGPLSMFHVGVKRDCPLGIQITLMHNKVGPFPKKILHGIVKTPSRDEGLRTPPPSEKGPVWERTPETSEKVSS